jgi:hypothetical protein
MLSAAALLTGRAVSLMIGRFALVLGHAYCFPPVPRR